MHAYYKLNKSGQKLDNLEFHNTIIEISRICQNHIVILVGTQCGDIIITIS